MTALGAPTGGARRPRCAEVAREVGAAPAGTAPTSAGFLLVEWPRPWPRDAGEVPELEEVARRAKGSGVRLQLVVPRDDARPDLARMVAYRRPDGEDFDGYRGREAAARPDELVAVADSLLTAPVDRWARPGEGVVDVLVCAHGSRDSCCGGSGTRALAAAAALDRPGRVRLWRTSHLGGHRFAPTALVLPSGTMWAFVDPALLAAVVGHDVPAASVVDRYRGCAALPTGAAQAAEGAVLAEVGWELLHRPRRVTVRDTTVVVEAAMPDGPARWVADVVPGRRVPSPPCGEPATPDGPHAVEVAVGPVRR